MSIIDRRATNKNKSVGNRQKFIERNKDRIKRSIDKTTSNKGITDAVSDRKVTVDGISEPEFNFDTETGERDVILTGNKDLANGDKIRRSPQSDKAGTGAADSGDGMDEFSFTLTKEEFLELYFSDLELPNFIKESLAGTVKHKFKRSGWSKEGVPARIDLLKTLKQSLSRRIATRQICLCLGREDKICIECTGTGFRKQRYLDDIDLRYKHFTKQPFPVKQATMILLMDTSGSMGQWEKDLAKKFFLLLYLFLNKVYKNVKVIFVAHTQVANEVTEEEFFYGRNSGGTIVSSGLALVKEIIDTRINLSETNVYIAQASDGDNWGDDDAVSTGLIEELLSKVQYFAYIQTEDADRLSDKREMEIEDLMTLYTGIAARYKNMQCKHVTDPNEVYPVLRSLFEGN